MPPEADLLTLAQVALTCWVAWEVLREAGAARLPVLLQSVLVIAVALALLWCPWPLVTDAGTVAALVALLGLMTRRTEQPQVIRRTARLSGP
ncbi:hypothetical protein ACIBCT_35640 [Streptosporangium sp. NPDC050855]|uniref:hypothetical protein n=1 Tax=Streptosporangium sp. NPDC050855 TaxID=3366194 RepID=UPI0037B6F889